MLDADIHGAFVSIEAGLIACAATGDFNVFASGRTTGLRCTGVAIVTVLVGGATIFTSRRDASSDGIAQVDGTGFSVFAFGVKLTAIGDVCMGAQESITEIVGTGISVITFDAVQPAIGRGYLMGAFSQDACIQGDGQSIIALSVIQAARFLAVRAQNEIVQNNANQMV